MAVKFNLDRLMFENGNMRVPQLQEISEINKNTLYAIYNNKAKRVDLNTLDSLCKALDCQPGDLLTYVPDEEEPS